MNTPNDITKTHYKYAEMLPFWTRVDTVVKGLDTIGLIPDLNPDDKSAEMASRNRQYKERALFLPIASRTADGLVGMAFADWPTLHAKTLEYVAENVDGAGMSIYQQAQKVLGEVITKGRAGLLVEYPRIGDMESVSLHDLQEMGAAATIQMFEPESIINWSIISSGARAQLGRVVIMGCYEDDEGEIQTSYRELVMVDKYYVTREWRQEVDSRTGKVSGDFVIYDERYPTDGNGERWTEIPFTFVGARSNTWDITTPPMLGLCNLNIAHYRNSAAYEDSVHMLGQPQPYMTGLDSHDQEQLTSAGLYIGCGRVITLPKDATLAYVQAQPNTLAKEAMDSKEEQAVRMGAVFITPGSGTKTATQVEGEKTVNHSILSLAASNVGEAYTKCLGWMAEYMAVDGEGLFFDVKRDFVSERADANMINAIVAAWSAGAITTSAKNSWFQKQEIEDPEKTSEEIQEEIQEGTVMNTDFLGDDGDAEDLGVQSV
jgi:hypothetical protein